MGRVCDGNCGRNSHADCVRLVTERSSFVRREGHAAVLTTQSAEPRDATWGPDAPAVRSVSGLDHLGVGDVVRISPTGQIRVLYRRASPHNSVLVTEQCNSFCVMCSQPPRVTDDRARFRELWRLIDLIDRGTKELGITGGEPTLFGSEFLEFIEHCRRKLPNTGLHVLTNGRVFRDREFAAELASIGHRDLMLGIPLYSDDDVVHDFVVQAEGAYWETVEGLLNLGEHAVSVEIRTVVHRHTLGRLGRLADFIARNLAFCSHVAVMGLEPFGFARSNFDDLWVDPVDYQPALLEVVSALQRSGVRVVLYNHQLCVLDRRLWPFAVKSISDWKNVYLSQCEGCCLQTDCGGFFQSATRRHSRGVAARRSL